MMTMGALVRFKDMTGKEAGHIDSTNIEELSRLIYCSVISACRREKIEFDMPFEDFLDFLDIDQLNSFYQNSQDAEKKTAVSPQK